jgi:hypothetical protein
MYSNIAPFRQHYYDTHKQFGTYVHIAWSSSFYNNNDWRLSAISVPSGEGPRNRRYGRTATLGLLVQPCDEDDDDDDYFLSFS